MRTEPVQKSRSLPLYLGAGMWYTWTRCIVLLHSWSLTHSSNLRLGCYLEKPPLSLLLLIYENKTCSENAIIPLISLRGTAIGLNRKHHSVLSGNVTHWRKKLAPWSFPWKKKKFTFLVFWKRTKHVQKMHSLPIIPVSRKVISYIGCIILLFSCSLTHWR